jgi:hypothetical protein
MRQRRSQRVVKLLIVALIGAFPGWILIASGAPAPSGDQVRSTAESELVAAYQALRAMPQQNPWHPTGPDLSDAVPEAARTHPQQLKRSLSDVVRRH